MTRNGYINRSIEAVIERAVDEFPVVVLTGTRQAGKTTLLKHLFADRFSYVSVEAPDVRLAATTDPRGFLDMHAPPLIIDEAHHAPDLLAYIKDRVDADRRRCGQYILTGSQNLLLLERVSESLAGMAAILRLTPLSFREEEGDPGASLPWEGSVPKRRTGTPANLWSRFVRGQYPELAANKGRDTRIWHSSYVQTYLERDVRSIRQIGDLVQFQGFMKLLSSRSASLVNITDLARDLGLAVNTVKAWISVLEASHQIIVLRPYHSSVSKRLVKTPKIYITDTGTLCFLTGVFDGSTARQGPMAGAIMETAVLLEIAKVLAGRGFEPRIWFWRTSTGDEVDFLVEHAGRLVPIEVKATATPRPSMADGISRLRAAVGDRVMPGYVVHTGDVKLPLGPDAIALPFSLL